jgi:hypothetical protein
MPTTGEYRTVRLTVFEERIVELLRAEVQEARVQERNRCISVVRDVEPDMGPARLRDVLCNAIVGHVPTPEEEVWMAKLRKEGSA